jgi:transposase
MMPQDVTFVGVDVSKSHLDVVVLGREGRRRFANRSAGWAQLIRALPAAAVGIEPSGGYERGLVGALLEAGVEVRWCDPARVRSLARALGAPAKTDAIDAAMIARYLAQTGGRPVKRDGEREALRDLLDGRAAALEAANRLAAQIESLRPGPARQALEALAASARREAGSLQSAILVFLRESQRLCAIWRRLQTAPGIGPLVAADLLARMPELGSVSGKAIAKLAGLAPFIRESGAWRGRATCSGGRPKPRRMLYMAAMASIRAKHGLRAVFEHLISKGKPRMVALVACMRRLLVSLNAMVRNQSAWKAVTA